MVLLIDRFNPLEPIPTRVLNLPHDSNRFANQDADRLSRSPKYTLAHGPVPLTVIVRYVHDPNCASINNDSVDHKLLHIEARISSHSCARIRVMATIDVSTLFSLAGKVALVTGGSRGIGHMIAHGYLKAGAKVYISSRKKEVCDHAAAELSGAGPCVSLPADIATTEGRTSLVKALRERETQLHILVNNAGANWGAPYDKFPEAGFRKVIDLNVTGLFFVTRALTSMLTRAATPDDPARIINIGSMDGIHVPKLARTGTFPYSASKAAVHHLTRTLAVELAPRHITVNAVAPGFFESKMTTEVLKRYRDDIEDACPLHRIGRPEEMAGIAIYLASRAGAYTNGTVIPVDGGTCIN